MCRVTLSQTLELNPEILGHSRKQPSWNVTCSGKSAERALPLACDGTGTAGSSDRGEGKPGAAAPQGEPSGTSPTLQPTGAEQGGSF